MKFILALIIMFSFAACDASKKEESNNEKTETHQEMNSQDESHEGHNHAENDEDEDESMDSIAPENDMCICTKDFRPVCGKDGNTYPNPCQAGCAKVEVAAEGACEE